jgi:hypothetical protein
MTDLEAVKLCAEAMGHRLDVDGGFSRMAQGAGMDEPNWFQFIYDPLHDKAQAFALVERFRMDCMWAHDTAQWLAGINTPCTHSASHPDLARAIVYCVAYMQAARRTEGE